MIDTEFLSKGKISIPLTPNFSNSCLSVVLHSKSGLRSRQITVLGI